MVCNSVMSNMYGNLNTKMMKHLDMKRRDMIKRELSQLIRERVEVRQSLYERSLENWPIVATAVQRRLQIRVSANQSELGQLFIVG